MTTGAEPHYGLGGLGKGLPPKKKKNLKKKRKNIIFTLFFKKFIVLTPQIIFFQFGPRKPKSWLRPE
jgi:hypothetical protein